MLRFWLPSASHGLEEGSLPSPVTQGSQPWIRDVVQRQSGS